MLNAKLAASFIRRPMHFHRTRQFTVTFSLKYKIFQGKPFLRQLNAVNSAKPRHTAICVVIFSSSQFKTDKTYVKICEVGALRNNLAR